MQGPLLQGLSGKAEKVPRSDFTKYKTKQRQGRVSISFLIYSLYNIDYLSVILGQHLFENQFKYYQSLMYKIMNEKITNTNSNTQV